MEKRKSQRFIVRNRQFIPLFLMVLPGVIYLIVNNYMPMFGLLIAFKKINYTDGIWKSPWCGFSNFTFLFSTNDAFLMFRNTILYNMAFIVFGNLVGIFTAIILDTIKKKWFRNMTQIIILMPYLLSIIIVSYITYAFLNPGNGFINNSILKPLGIQGISWYTDPKPWPVIIPVVFLWMGFGYSSIIYYSTLIGIDTTLYEAAVVDGAGIWKQIRHVTFPCIKKTVIMLVILSVGRICYSDIGLFYQIPMNSGMLYKTTQTIDTYVYRALLEQNSVGRSAAAGFFQSILGFVLVVTTNTIVNRIDSESALY